MPNIVGKTPGALRYSLFVAYPPWPVLGCRVFRLRNAIGSPMPSWFWNTSLGFPRGWRGSKVLLTAVLLLRNFPPKTALPDTWRSLSLRGSVGKPSFHSSRCKIGCLLFSFLLVPFVWPLSFLRSKSPLNSPDFSWDFATEGKFSCDFAVPDPHNRRKIQNLPA